MKTQPIFRIYCPSCNNSTNHHGVKSETKRYSDEDYQSRDTFEIIECNGCEQVSFRHIHTDSEDFHSETGEPAESITIYPKRGRHFREVKNYWYAGNTVNKIYKETLECYNHDLPILCSAGLRAIIESICSDKGVKGGMTDEYENGKVVLDESGAPKRKFNDKLVGKINGLAESHIITENQSIPLHQLRMLGNDALHDGEEPELNNLLNDCIEIIEHVLHAVYEIQMQGERVKRDRLFSKSLRKKPAKE